MSKILHIATDKAGELLTMSDGSIWLHPFSGATPVCEKEAGFPVCVKVRNNRHYWIVAVEADKPVYNVTNGKRPSVTSGYYDLRALMRLKGDVL